MQRPDFIKQADNSEMDAKPRQLDQDKAIKIRVVHPSPIHGHTGTRA